MVVGGCREGNRDQPPAARAEARTVRLTGIQTRPAERFVEITGTVFGEEEVDLSAEVPGRVVAIHAQLGDIVPHGGLLAQIDPTDFQLAVEEQRAALTAALARIGLDSLPEGEIEFSKLPVVARADAQQSNASARLDRARKLYERTPPLISEQDFADIQTQQEVASTSAAVERLTARSLVAEARVRDSSLRTALQRLKDTEVRAPAETGLNYRVAARRASVGEIVTEGRALYRLVASDRVTFRGLVPERFAAAVSANARAQILLDVSPVPFEAAVSRVSPAVDIATRSFEVEIEAENKDGRLKPGSFARAKIFVGTDPQARFVPTTAVYQFAGVSRLYAVRDGKVVEHRVEVGEVSDGMRELLKAPADLVQVIDAPRALREGLAVAVQP